MSLIWSYIRQEIRKCSSVSTSFCEHCAHSRSSREPWLPTAAFLNSKAMLTESVHSQSFPLVWVSHSGQVFCHCVLSVSGQIAF